MKALIPVDIENDFLPKGALPVPKGDQVIEETNRLMREYDFVFPSLDWHPADHGSFAINHPGRELYEIIDLHGIPQRLWPVHGVQNTYGAEFAAGLDTARFTKTIYKGTDPKVDSYSAFFDNGRKGDTGLHELLCSHNVGLIGVCGLATDYCVKATVIDGLSLGYKVILHTKACRGVNLAPGDVEAAIEEMRRAGAEIR